ncbi:DUF724 domain-containing protein 2 [Bienertia sinuspersici]
MKMQPKSKNKRLDNQRKHPTTTSPPSFPINQSQILHNHPLFPFGSEVEVTSDEEGFKGAWYLATVIQSPTSSHSPQEEGGGKILVEYKNLLSDENGNTLLKEFVDAKFVRPKHPIEDDDKVIFEVNDVVDAFFQDGWWCGVVTEVVAKNKYRVFFSNPPDEMEFQSFKLRIHKDWVDGKWALPEKVRMRDLNFKPGTAVEVNCDSDISCDIWFPATLIKQVANNCFLVEYQSSKEAGLQKVAVDSFHIRPPPPSSSNKPFNLLEKVDAFYDFRWLSGVVTKILADGRYIVYFKRTKKEKELSHADLRLHMEWHNNKWIQSFQDTSMTSNAEKHSNHMANGNNKEKTHASSEGSDAAKDNVALDKIPSSPTIPLKSCTKKLQMPGNEEANRSGPVTVPSKKRRKTSANGNASHSRPSRRTNEESASDVSLSSDTCKSKMAQLEVSYNGISVDVNLPTPGHLQSNVKQSEGSSPTDMEGSEQQKEGEVTNLKRKRGRPPKVLGSSKTHEAECVEEKKDDTSDPNGDASDPKDDACLPRDDEIHSPTSEVVKPVATVEPYQISGSSPTDDGIKPVGKSSDQMNRLSDIRKLSTSRRQVRKRKKVPTKSVMMDVNEPMKAVILSKGKKQKSTKQVVPQVLDDVDNSKIRAIEVFNNGIAGDVDRVVAGTSSNASDDDRPLSTWFEGAHPPTVDAKISSSGTAGQSGESGQEIKTAPINQLKDKEQEKREYTSVENVSKEQDKNVPGGLDKVAKQSESSANAIVAVDSQELPFVKNSLVWQMIESMEVLKRVPQKPHFRPLYNCKEECREGLAIGSMVTFTSLVERISKSQFSDPKSLLDGYLEALFDLEDLGFNVAPVREQLNKMISIKDRYDQAQNTSKEIESQITDRNMEKSEINEEITAIDRKIGELMEKRSLVMAKKERKDAEIQLLQSSIDAVKTALESAEQEFEKAATSPW